MEENSPPANTDRGIVNSLRQTIHTFRYPEFRNLFERASSILIAASLMDEDDHHAMRDSFGAPLTGLSGTRPIFSAGLSSNYELERLGNEWGKTGETVPWALTADQLLETQMATWLSLLKYDRESGQERRMQWEKNVFMPDNLRELTAEYLSGAKGFEEFLGGFEASYKKIFNFDAPLFGYERAQTQGETLPFQAYLSPGDFYSHAPGSQMEKMLDGVLSKTMPEESGSSTLVARIVGLPSIEYQEELRQRGNELSGDWPQQIKFAKDIYRKVSANIFMVSFLRILQAEVAKVGTAKGISGRVETEFRGGRLVTKVNPNEEPWPFAFSLRVAPDEKTLGPNYRRSGEGYQRSAVEIYLSKLRA